MSKYLYVNKIPDTFTLPTRPKSKKMITEEESAKNREYYLMQKTRHARYIKKLDDKIANIRGRNET